MMNNVLNALNSLRNQKAGEQKRIDVDSPLSVLFGVNKNGQLRLSFLSTLKPPKFESTKNIEIVQGPDPTATYWLNFDLLISGQENVFIAFCENIVDAIAYTTTEEQAFVALKKRYARWKSLFKKPAVAEIPKEVIQGVYGELYFLEKYMIPKFGVNHAIKAWAGAEGLSKDFSIGSMWYEVKTIGNKSPIVTISSFAQLDSENEGRLVINRIEQMSDEYNSNEDCIKKIFDLIRAQINDDAVESDFFEKMSLSGVTQSDKAMERKFSMHSMSFYKVDKAFPKLTRQNVVFQEICDAEYSLSVDALKKYEVNSDD